MVNILNTLTPPHAVIIAGSGLSSELSTIVKNQVRVPYSEIPQLPQTSTTVHGHQGELVSGSTKAGTPVWVFAGRFHLYQNLTAKQVAKPVHLAAKRGAKLLITTNAGGTTQPHWELGDIAGITDHVNMTGKTPLKGPKFVDLTEAYNPNLLRLAKKTAHDKGVKWREGVYAATLGPAYETAAEVTMLEKAGVHIVGMSTVFETITARYLGMRVCGLSVITNYATGVPCSSHDHVSVVNIAEKSAISLKHITATLADSDRHAHSL